MSVINRGVVDWSGENPGIYLKDPADLQGPWVAVAVYFRVIYSAYGRGRGMIVLGAPNLAKGYPDAPNLCIAENLPLMRYLLKEFVPNYGSFHGAPALEHTTLIQATGGATDSANASAWQETLCADGVELSMRWSGLGKPFAADVGADRTSTGRHQMYSLFQGAQSGQILLNGKPLAGVTMERDFLGGKLGSAFLAFAESWVVPDTQS
jgi:hypothetical protein